MANVENLGYLKQSITVKLFSNNKKKYIECIDKRYNFDSSEIRKMY